ncbi:MAG: pilus assembly PilX N-terminal domain-containing protein [bacterium]
MNETSTTPPPGRDRDAVTPPLGGNPGVPTPFPSADRGSILVIVLIMLVVFTLVGTTILTLSNTEGQISRNHKGDTQALFVAESGAQLAYKSLAANNFQAWTHQPDGTPEVQQPLVPIPFPGRLVIDGPGSNGLHDERDDGCLVWEWAPGDTGRSLTGTKAVETFRVSVHRASVDPTDNQFVIDVEGMVGTFRQRLQVRGYTESIYHYALFSDGPLSEFTRGEDQTITGKIHANGDMYFRPWDPRTLTIDAPSVTATGRMIRTTDIFGRDLYSGSHVLIKDPAGNLVEMALGAPGTAMDSQNAAWADEDPTNSAHGALELWGGIVRDGSLGAVRVDPPPVQTIERGGWYDQRAAIRLRAGDVQLDAAGNDISGTIGAAVHEVTFWNPAIGQNVTVQELDMAQLQASGVFPANGLIYSDVPLRIVNASQLAGDLTIVSANSVYTKGDFNSVNKRPAAIISKARIWNLSNAWSDADTKTKGSINGRQASNGTTTVNAALVDGQPAIGTAQYADLNHDGHPDDPSAGNAIANADQLLEAWGGSRTLRKYGSIIHLQFADMADNVRNNGIRPDETAWIRFGAYDPPVRDYEYDPALQASGGQPPFTPLTGKIFLWQQLGS